MLAEATNPRKRFGSQSHLCQPNRIKFTGYLNLINLAFIAEIVLVGGMLPFFFRKTFGFSNNCFSWSWLKQRNPRAVSLQTKIVSRSRFIKRRLFAKNEDITKQKNGISFKVTTLSIIQPGTNDHHCHMGGNDKNIAKWREARCKPRFRVQTEQLRCAFLCVWWPKLIWVYNLDSVKKWRNLRGTPGQNPWSSFLGGSGERILQYKSSPVSHNGYSSPYELPNNFQETNKTIVVKFILNLSSETHPPRLWRLMPFDLAIKQTIVGSPQSRPTTDTNST